MIGNLFHTALYTPIYNLLVFFVDVIPGANLGLAVIAITIIIKLILMPLSLSAVRTARAMQILQPKLKDIQERLKDNQEQAAKETFALYKKYRVNPFAGVLLPFIQLPILIALYFVVRSHSLVEIDASLLYPFVHAPAALNTFFLGLPVTKPDLILALIAAFSQFLQARYAIPIPPKSKEVSMQAEFGRAMAIQMRILFPVMIGIFSYASGAIALYFIMSNVLLLIQEYIVRKLPHPAVTAHKQESVEAGA